MIVEFKETVKQSIRNNSRTQNMMIFMQSPNLNYLPESLRYGRLPKVGYAAVAEY